VGVTGLLGGAFDPPHNGHVVLAREALRQLDLRCLVVVVTGCPPHKTVETDAENRFRLAQAAFTEVPRVELSRHELDRPGRSYTVETVRWAAARWGEVLLVIGADEFAGFLDWHDPEGVLRAARLAVATRPGFSADRLSPVLAALSEPGRIELFEIPALPVSSTEVRSRVRRGEPIDDLVPRQVAGLIDELGLYRDASGLDPHPPTPLA
jgi:nicotinate-nucleotide adenylyltransferase